MDDLIPWLSKQPLWIQEILKQEKNLSESSIPVAVKFCLEEARNILKSSLGIPILSFSEKTARIELVSLENISGISKLSSFSNITFNPNLTLIYGRNGSGKTSYVNIINNARNPMSVKLINNIFERNKKNQQYSLKYKLNDSENVFCYPVTEDFSDENNPLRNIDIFSDSKEELLTGQNDCNYVPASLKFLASLSDFYDKVRLELLEKQNMLVSPLTQLPNNFLMTKQGSLYEENKNNVSDDYIKAIKWDEKEESNLIEIVNRLDTSKVAKALKETENKLQTLTILISYYDLIISVISEESLKKLSSLANFTIEKRIISTEAARVISLESMLTGVGSETWKELWIAAKHYSEKEAYSNISFPNVMDNSVCVLCHQKLDNNSKQRMTHFNNYVTGTIENQYNRAYRKYLEHNIFQITIKPNEVLEIIQYLEIEKNEIQVFLSNLEEINSWTEKEIKTLTNNFNNPLFHIMDEEYRFLTDLQIKLQLLKEQQEKDLKPENQPQLQKQMIELQAKKWIFEHKEELVKQQTYLSQHNLYAKALSLTRTNETTKKARILGQELLTEEFTFNFNSALKELGAETIQVALKTQAPHKGRSKFYITLTDCDSDAEIKNILSNGEKRIITLAAAIAESKLAKHSTPFIFDDPISSLDFDYEKKLSIFLNGLSKNRQVIIFTHRLSFVVALSKNIPSSSCKMMLIENIKGLGSGINNENVIFGNSNVSKETNQLLIKIENYITIKTRDPEQYISNYTDWKNSCCSTFRKLIELSIEKILLNSSVERFGIIHSSNIKKLYLITESDCQLLDNNMTKYSYFEHSQPDDVPAPNISLEDVETDCRNFKDWIKNFNSR